MDPTELAVEILKWAAVVVGAFSFAVRCLEMVVDHTSLSKRDVQLDRLRNYLELAITVMRRIGFHPPREALAQVGKKHAAKSGSGSKSDGKARSGQKGGQSSKGQGGFISLRLLVGLAILPLVLPLLSGCAALGDQSEKFDSWNDRLIIIKTARKSIADNTAMLYRSGEIDRAAANEIDEYLTRVYETENAIQAAVEAGDFDEANSKVELAREALESARGVINTLTGGNGDGQSNADYADPAWTVRGGLGGVSGVGTGPG